MAKARAAIQYAIDTRLDIYEHPETGLIRLPTSQSRRLPPIRPPRQPIRDRGGIWFWRLKARVSRSDPF
jgi:hypothetical protein